MFDGTGLTGGCPPSSTDVPDTSFFGYIVSLFPSIACVINAIVFAYQPPVLQPSKNKVDGLAFLGLSLSRRSDVGQKSSQTRQEAFDLNEVQDRDCKK